jgi:hypothetical protein
MITTNDLLYHLETIVSDLKENTISDEMKRELTLFYIRTKYPEMTCDDMKYFVIGWYIYEIILKTNIIK